MILIQTKDLQKYYGATPILQKITMQVQTGERLGLVGVNGAGKSTLLRILAGELQADGGDIYRSKTLTVGYLEQASHDLFPGSVLEALEEAQADLMDMEQQLREMEVQMADPEVHRSEKRFAEISERYARLGDLFEGRGGYERNTRLRSVMHGMGFGDTPDDFKAERLSGGQKTRLALARLLLREPDVLLLDEPTNHLDIATLQWLEAFLRSYRGAILTVSHDRYFLDAITSGIIEIDRQQAKRYVGNYSKFIDLKAAEYEQQLKRFEAQQDEIAGMEDFVRRNLARASTTKRAQSRRKALEKMDRLDSPNRVQKASAFSFQVKRQTGNDVLTVEQLAAGFADGPSLFEAVSFRLTRGETAALIGPNGIGKSTLLKTLLGQLEKRAGQVKWGSNVEIGYYDQEQASLTGSNTVLQEVWNAFPMLEEVRVRTVLGTFMFSGEDVLKPVSGLSGGEKARVALAKLMLKNANVLLLDEPTNHLDVYSREVLESALVDYEGTILFISHDRYFLNKMAEKMLEMSAAGVREYLGDYDAYTEKKAEIAELAAEAAAEQAARVARAGTRGHGPAGAAGGAATASGSATASSGNAVGGSASAASSAGGVAAGSGAVSSDAAAPRNANSLPMDREQRKQIQRLRRSLQRTIEETESDIAELETKLAELEEIITDPEIIADYEKLHETTLATDECQKKREHFYKKWEIAMAELESLPSEE